MAMLLTPVVWLRVPLYNQIAAGLPLTEAEQIGTRWIRAPQSHNPSDQYCCVRVSGNSLVGARICDGDTVVIRLTKRLDFNGQLAAVLTPDGLTLKYTWLEPGGSVRLKSRNLKYPDRVLSIDEVTIQGVVVRTEIDQRKESSQ